MADPDTNYIAPSTGEKDTQTKPNETKTDDWKTIVGNKYQSEAELAKAYKELETKLGQQSEDVRKGREFAETVAPVLDIIKNDPEAFKIIDEKLRKLSEPKEETKDTSDKKVQKDEESRQALLEVLRVNFEKEYGFDKLSPEDQGNLRKKMGKEYLDMTGQQLLDVDLRRFRAAFEKAYILATQKDKRTDQEEETEEPGAFSSIPSSRGKGTPKITPEEAKVASSLGLTTEKYLAGKNK